MAIHLLVYYSHLAASGRPDSPIPDTTLTPITDGIVGRAGSAGYYVPRGMRVIGAHAVGSGTKTVSGTTSPIDPLASARLFTPSLMRVGAPSIVPLQGNASTFDASNAPLAPATPPVSQWLLGHGLAVQENEVLEVRAQTRSPTDASYTYAVDLWAFVWLSDGLIPLPPGDIFWVSSPSNLHAADVRPGVWSAVPDSGNSSFPAGKYAVVGLDYHAVNPASDFDPTLAARLVFPGQAWRPGIAAVNGLYTRNECAAYDGRLGVLGVFEAFALPTLEVFAIGTPTADFSPVVNIGLIKIS